MFYKILCLVVVLCGFPSEGNELDASEWSKLAVRIPEIHLVIDSFNNVRSPHPQSDDNSRRAYHSAFFRSDDGRNDGTAVWKSAGSNFTEDVIDSSESKCNRDITYTMANINQLWAVNMLDATGKPSAGILRGGVTWLGNEKQCQDVSVPEVIKNGSQVVGGFNGHQCLVQWSLSLGVLQVLSFKTGVCFPNSCSSEDLKNKSNSLTAFVGYIPGLNAANNTLQVTSVDCSDHKRSWTGGDVAYMIILAIFCSLVTVGTLWDIWNRIEKKIFYVLLKNKGEVESYNHHDNLAINIDDEENMPQNTIMVVGKEQASLPVQPENKNDSPKPEAGFIEELFICFSLYTNIARLINVGDQKGQLSCLHGIRFLSMTWVILGHTFLSAASAVVNPLDVISELIDSFSFLAVTQGTYSVDSFFFLSGFLLGYLFLREYGKSENKSVNWAYYYLHRLWRLSPAFFMVLGFYTTLWLHLGSGPLWPTETENGKCDKYWWWDVLYILNFQKSSKMCMAWAWYLANDMQFYVISPLFLMFLWKLPIVGIVLIGAVMLASWIATGVISSNNGMQYLFEPGNSNGTGIDSALQANGLENLFDDIYVKPYCRIGPYLVGILVGYALYKTGTHQKVIKVWMSIAGWLIALFLMSIVIFGIYHSNMGIKTTAAYNALSRTAWSIGLGWVVYSCLTGLGGPFNTLLSWKFWVPLSRLTYCAYLVHPLVLGWYFSSLQFLLHFEVKTMVIYYLGFLVASYLAAFVTTLVFESPMMAVEKVVLKHFSSK